jgi:S-adenosylmethionine:tRNA ribosyltransferase-isomerase
MNNTQVIPARLYGHKSTGAEIEVLLLEERKNNCWLALVKPGKRFKVGASIVFPAREVGEAWCGGQGDKETRRQGEISSSFLPSPSPPLTPSSSLTATVLETG